MISLRIEKLCSSAPRAKDNRGTAARAINPNRHNYPTHSFHLPMHFVSTCLLFIAECDIASFLRCPAGAPLQDDAPYCIIDIWEERHFRPRVKDHFYANPKMRHSSPYNRIHSACAYLPRMRRSPDLPAWIALAASLSRLSSGLSSDSAPTGLIGHATRAQRLLEGGLGKGEGAGRIATEDYRNNSHPSNKASRSATPEGRKTDYTAGSSADLEASHSIGFQSRTQPADRPTGPRPFREMPKAASRSYRR